jgi:hypothetical protein
VNQGSALVIAAILGLFAYGQARRDGSRLALVEWTLGVAFFIGAVVFYSTGFRAEFERAANRTTTVLLFLAMVAVPAILAGEVLRFTSRRNLSPSKVGASMFLASYLLINLAYFAIRVKEPT